MHRLHVDGRARNRISEGGGQAYGENEEALQKKA